MANELAALTEFTGNLFRHAYFCLPWFCKNSKGYRYQVNDYDVVVRALQCLKKNKPRFFGPGKKLAKANDMLMECFEHLDPDGNAESNEVALEHYAQAWHWAWKNRVDLQLRGHESRLMKFFHEITEKADPKHFLELQAMARVVDFQIVPLIRSIIPPDGCSPVNELEKTRSQLDSWKVRLFAGCEINPQSCQKAKKENADIFKEYQHTLRDHKRAVLLRISEIFDERNWHPTIDSATLHIVLNNEGLEEYLPYTYRGRVGVQPTGYPLTFYTYNELELDKPPLNEVKMNMNYGVEEKDKDYGIHPVDDGTFYCQTKAVVGDSYVKYYTLQYKRRARRMKYDKVDKLAQSINKIRRRLLKHVQSPDRDTWVRALMCMIIDSKCARIGNVESTKGEKKTYGITTLLTAKHVQIKDGFITIKYKGKHAQPQRHKFKINETNQRKKIIAQRLMELISEENEFLFTRANGKPFTPQSVNDYFTADKPNSDKGLSEGGAAAPCTVHNLRNYHATRIFREFAQKFTKEHKTATYQQVLEAYQGRNKTAKKRGKKGVLDKIAEKLGNTPAICRKAYIDPRQQLLFFKQWDFRPPDCLIRDVFVHEPTDTYKTETEPAQKIPANPCGVPVCQVKSEFLPSFFEDIAAKREESARKRHKKLPNN